MTTLRQKSAAVNGRGRQYGFQQTTLNIESVGRTIMGINTAFNKQRRQKRRTAKKEITVCFTRLSSKHQVKKSSQPPRQIFTFHDRWKLIVQETSPNNKSDDKHMTIKRQFSPAEAKQGVKRRNSHPSRTDFYL